MSKRLGVESERKGKGKGQQSMTECDECDQNDEYYSVPIQSLSCGEIESQVLKMASEEWQVPVKRVTSTCIKTKAGNRQFTCNNRFDAIAQQSHDKKTKQEGERVMFDCDSDVMRRMRRGERRRTGRM